MHKFLSVLTLLVLVSACGGEGGSGGTGQAGSTSRFAIVDNYLYAISGDSDVQMFDISDPAQPQPWAKIDTWWGLETLFPYNGYLFVGSRSDVRIYDNSDPSNPVYITNFQHATSCDPVVVQGNYAYVTLRSGLGCQVGVDVADVLQVVDISNIENPQLVKTVNMQNPKGLGIDGDLLFVCDGIAGMKVFDVAIPDDPTWLETEPGLDCYDLIAADNTLAVTDPLGIIQYSYGTLPLQKLSEIPVVDASTNL